jgi:two-component system LytT family response regulator
MRTGDAGPNDRMTRFHALVADDEPLAREMVAALLRADPDIDSVVECGDAACTRDAIQRLRPDIVFLDIEMPGSTGLEIAEHLDTRGPVVVFITAFSSYATKAFDVSAVDYVLKPFSDQRFANAIDRAKRRVRERRLGELASQVASLSAELRDDEVGSIQKSAPGSAPTFLQRLAFKDGDRSIVVKTADIIWIEAEDYYVLIHTKQGRHMIRASLVALEQRLDPLRFRRVHRTAIVNVEEVRTLQERGGLHLTLSDGAEVAVSRARRSQIEQLLRPRLR